MLLRVTSGARTPVFDAENLKNKKLHAPSCHHDNGNAKKGCVNDGLACEEVNSGRHSTNRSA